MSTDDPESPPPLLGDDVLADGVDAYPPEAYADDGPGYTAADVLPAAPPRPPPNVLILPKAANYGCAIAVRAWWDHQGERVRCWRGEWFVYRSGLWRRVPPDVIIRRLYETTAAAVAWNAKKEVFEDWSPSRSKVRDLLDALAAAAAIDHDVEPGAWIATGEPAGLVNVANGLLALEGRVLHQHTPELFSTVQLAVDYDPAAPAPTRWLRFLHEVFPGEDGHGDDEAVTALQHWYGYVVSGKTHLQKALFLKGERRSGKGTIATILRELLGGASQVPGPTAAAFGERFGLAPLIGRSLAISPDLRMSPRGAAEFVERILTITGNDAIDIDRKNQAMWSGVLGTRLMFLSNNALGTVDTSGALASRFILLETKGSWLGREDHHLLEDLLDELGGILLWALDGFDHIIAGGRIEEPASSADLRADVDAMGSSEGAFLEDTCQLDRDAEEDVAVLFAVYCAWRAAQRMSSPKDKRRFLADLRPRIGGKRARPSNGRYRQPGVRVDPTKLDAQMRRAIRDELGWTNPLSDDARFDPEKAPDRVAAKSNGTGRTAMRWL
jgi:putative DNA primase/helicase